MMGNRGATTGAEHDAFSRRSRPLLSWGRGELRRLKRAFAKRSRRNGKTETTGDGPRTA